MNNFLASSIADDFVGFVGPASNSVSPRAAGDFDDAITVIKFFFFPLTAADEQLSRNNHSG
jgi:hypothetical protein